jgi:hypothetical protein
MKGDLLPVPRELRFEQFLAFLLGFRVEDRNDGLSAKV